MKRAEKEVIKAGLETYLAAEERRDINALRQMRMLAQHHRGLREPRGANNYRELARAQIIIIRRTRLMLAAVRAEKQREAALEDAPDAPAIDLKDIFESDSDRCVKCGLTRKEITEGFGLYGSQSCHGEFDDGDNVAAGFRYPVPGGEHQFEEVAI